MQGKVISNMPIKEKSHLIYVAGSNKIQCKIISAFFVLRFFFADT